MKTKTITVTATREYIAQEVVTFDLEIPDFPRIKRETIDRIAQNYIDATYDLAWEHDESREPTTRPKSLSLAFEDKKAD